MFDYSFLREYLTINEGAHGEGWMTGLNRTHDPARKSWVESANLASSDSINRWFFRFKTSPLAFSKALPARASGSRSATKSSMFRPRCRLVFWTAKLVTLRVSQQAEASTP
jgi:hypothetical protein